MTKQEKKTLAKILESMKDPTVPIASYDENFKRTEAPELVPGVPNSELLSDRMFKAGYEQCYKQFVEYLRMLNAPVVDQIKFAGKAK